VEAAEPAASPRKQRIRSDPYASSHGDESADADQSRQPRRSQLQLSAGGGFPLM
jgi:hypothetical protein